MQKYKFSNYKKFQYSISKFQTKGSNREVQIGNASGELVYSGQIYDHFNMLSSSEKQVKNIINNF